MDRYSVRAPARPLQLASTSTDGSTDLRDLLLSRTLPDRMQRLVDEPELLQGMDLEDREDVFVSMIMDMKRRLPPRFLDALVFTFFGASLGFALTVIVTRLLR